VRRARSGSRRCALGEVRAGKQTARRGCRRELTRARPPPSRSRSTWLACGTCLAEWGDTLSSLRRRRLPPARRRTVEDRGGATDFEEPRREGDGPPWFFSGPGGVLVTGSERPPLAAPTGTGSRGGTRFQGAGAAPRPAREEFGLVALRQRPCRKGREGVFVTIVGGVRRGACGGAGFVGAVARGPGGSTRACSSTRGGLSYRRAGPRARDDGPVFQGTIDTSGRLRRAGFRRLRAGRGRVTDVPPGGLTA